jgi:adenosine deaminase
MDLILDQCRLPKTTVVNNANNQTLEIAKDDKRNLKECFKMFDIIYQLTNDDVHVITRITRETIEDYAAENTIYLELRTTPRRIGSHTKQDYVNYVIEGIKQYYASQGATDIVVKLLLTIDRSKSIEEAEENVKLAHEYATCPNPFVVGVDFSGNPYRGTFEQFHSVISDARHKYKLPLAIHFAEVSNDKESNLIMDFVPDRVGHGICFESEETLNRFIKSGIPLEVCLSSNYATTVAVDAHPFAKFINSTDMIHCLNTDDRGIFQTTLTKEYMIAEEHYGVTKQDMIDMQLKMIDHIFMKDEQERDKLRNKLKQF